MTTTITHSTRKFYQKKFFPILLFLCCFVFQVQAQPSFCVSNAVGNSSVTVDVTVENFTEIIGLQFSTIWDSDVLEFDSVSNLNFANAQVFNSFGTTQTDNGILHLSLTDNTFNSVTLPDGTILFSITFTVINNGFSAVRIAEGPDLIQLEIIELGNTTLGINDVNLKAGGVNGMGVLLSGNVFSDENSDCDLTVGETGFDNFILTIEKFGVNYYTTSNTNGDYSILLDTGTYVITSQNLNSLWQPCQSSYEVNLTDIATPITQNIPLQPLVSCSAMEVDLSTPFLRRCFESTYFVNYCNNGTITAIDSYVEIELDSFLSFDSSSIPLASQVGNTLTFDLGDVESRACGNFYIRVMVSCDAELGETHCSAAHIYPDEICDIPNVWSGASLEVDANCNSLGDSIYFTISNVGAENMLEESNYIVIEDAIMLMTMVPVPPLMSNQSISFAIPADGSTYRMEVEQVANHPGQSMPSVTVEGCGTNANGNVSLGFVNQFPQDDANPFISIDCRENIGAFDPNDKQAFPRGYGNENFIEKNVDLEYLIRFQNTGTDTAFNVVVRDTLSEFLDVSTLRLGASSHSVDFEMVGNGVAVFSFPNIMLPDSNVNEAASNGFVKFRIAQKPDLPNGTVLENEAAIFFDFNEPIITNKVIHTIGENFILLNDQNVWLSNTTVKTYPNPFVEMVNFEIEGQDFKSIQLQIYDLMGRLVQTSNHSNLSSSQAGTTFTFHRKNLLSGMYVYVLSGDGVPISSGKMTVK